MDLSQSSAKTYRKLEEEGRHVYQIAKGFGMEVLQYDLKNVPSDLEVIFSQSDIITIHLPEHESTYKLITMDLFRAMKKSAYFINTARGSIVDELAMLKALKYNIIAGAAVDVGDEWHLFENIEGLNLIVTDHIAGSTIEDRVKTDQHIVSMLRDVINYDHKPLGI